MACISIRNKVVSTETSEFTKEKLSSLESFSVIGFNEKTGC